MLVALFFVYRSFYGMRITGQAKATSEPKPTNRKAPAPEHATAAR